MWPIYDTPAQIVAVLKDLGVTNYRISLTNSSGLSIGISTAQALQNAGINFLVAVTYGISDGTSLLYTDEQSVYNGIRPGAAALAKALAPYGVTTFEAGNELTRDPFIIVNSAYAGTAQTDFNNTHWPIMRGAIRGMIDGIKSVNSTFRVGVNFCVADVAAADMLWEGIQPDGSTTYSNGTSYPKIKWDITTWHNYGAYGDLFDIPSDGGVTSFNIPVYAKARYGVPFWITEWNSFNTPSYTEEQRLAYVQQQLTEFYNN